MALPKSDGGATSIFLDLLFIQIAAIVRCEYDRDEFTGVRFDFCLCPAERTLWPISNCHCYPDSDRYCPGGQADIPLW